MTEQGNIPPTTVSPQSIGHWGVRTTPDSYDAMVQWHLDFFAAQKAWSGGHATMIAWDDEHHREVIVANEDFKPVENRRKIGGIYHIAFTLPTLAALAKSYEEKKARGIIPHWPVNHGMTTSMYYFDPDGNEFELQVDNFDTTEEVRAFMAGAEYAENPIGVDLDVDEWLAKVHSGVDERVLKRRDNIGKRATRFENSFYFKAGHKDTYTGVKADS